MAQASGFWKWYAQVNDDVRHQLIDRHRGQGSTDQAMERNVDAMASREPKPVSVYEGVQTPNPHVPEALQGIGTRVEEDHAENVKSTMERFYGQRGRAQPEGAEIDRFFGRGQDAPEAPTPEQAQEREAAMRRFYGNTAYEPHRLDDHTARLARDAEIDKYYDRDDGQER